MVLNNLISVFTSAVVDFIIAWRGDLRNPAFSDPPRHNLRGAVEVGSAVSVKDSSAGWYAGDPANEVMRIRTPRYDVSACVCLLVCDLLDHLINQPLGIAVPAEVRINQGAESGWKVARLEQKRYHLSVSMIEREGVKDEVFE